MIDRRLRPTRAPRPTARASERPRNKRSSLPIVAFLLVSAFLLGRLSSSIEPPKEEPAAGVRTSTASTADCAACAAPVPATNAATSSVALCPCPKPRKKADPKLTLKRKTKPPIETPAAAAMDPTEATARYLKAHAAELAACAPPSPGELRVHLEVTVSPKGGIDRVQVTNLDPLPSGVSACVEEKIARFSPPGFDASKPETFALTVVL